MSDSHGHRAFAFHKVLDDFPMKVDLLIPYGDQLIACCQTALCFLAERTTVDGETQFHYTKSVSKFCRRSVEQLCIMEDTDLLLTLSEGKISCHRLAKLMGQAQQESGEQARYLDEALSRIRQCDMFAVDLKRNGKHRLCAACRKKLVILYWNPEEGAFHEEKELAIPDKVRAMSWSGSNICVGFKREYCLIDVETQKISSGVSTGRSQNPMMCSLMTSELILLKEFIGMFVDAEGNPSRQHGISFHESPNLFESSWPYLICLMPHAVRIYILTEESDLSVVQELPLPGMRRSSIPNVSGSIGSSSRAESGRASSSSQLAVSPPTNKGWIFVYSDTAIYLMVRVPFAVQVDDLKSKGRFREALNLCNIMDGGGNVEEKFEKMELIQVEYGAHLFQERQFKEAFQLWEAAYVDPILLLTLFPCLMPSWLRDSSGKTPAQRFAEIVTLEESCRPEIKAKVQMHASIITSATPIEAGTELFRHALLDLIVYLKRRRVPFKVELDRFEEKKAQAHDTALVKAFVLADQVDSVRVFVKLENRCLVEETCEALRQAGLLELLKEFYQTRNMHQQALDLLQEAMADLSQHPWAEDAMITYLQNLDPKYMDLLFAKAEWLIQRNSSYTQQIFCYADRPNPLDPEIVFQFLERFGPSLPKECIVQYLEWVVDQKKGGDVPTVLNEALGESYLSAVLELHRKTPNHRFTPHIQEERTVEMRELRVRFLDFLVSSSKEDIQSTILTKLVTEEGLDEERATLLVLLGRFDNAADVYINVLRDPEAAVKALERRMEQMDSDPADAIRPLLSHLLRPRGSHDASGSSSESAMASVMGKDPVEYGLFVLNKHIYKFKRPQEALSLLPEDAPLHIVKHVLKAIVKSSLQRKKQTQVKRNLYRSENLKVKELWIHERSRRVKIDSSTMCMVCKKKLGTSAFATYPNGVVVHFHCSKDALDIDPITGLQFRMLGSEL